MTIGTGKSMRRARYLGLALLAGVMLAPLPALAQAGAPSMRVEAGITKAISPHVHVIPANGRTGVPNVGIVAGTRAVLVIETGLGKASGATVLAETRKIAGARRIYVIATHSHLEHLGGEQAFPPTAIVLRPLGQQAEVDSMGAQAVEGFRSFSADNKLLLKDFAYRPADIVFDGGTTLDLGGVTVDIVAAAPAHTDGDIALLVKQDGVLFTGDVVQQNYVPFLAGVHSSLPSWLAQIDKLEKLPATIIVPSHTAVTDRRAFADMRGMIVYLRDRWAELKAKGMDPAKATEQLVADTKARYPACTNADLLRMTAARF